MWRQVTDEVSWVLIERMIQHGEEQPGWAVICCSELPPGIFLFVTMLKIMKKLTEGVNWREATFTTRTSCVHSQGQGTDTGADADLLFPVLWCGSPPLETGGCGRIPAVRWDCAAPQTWPAGQGSVLMAELQSRYEAEVLWSRTSACYSVMLGLPGGMESKMLS